MAQNCNCASRFHRLALIAIFVILFVRTAVTQPTTSPALFLPAATYDGGGYYSFSVAAADLNKDGNVDLIVSNTCSDPDPEQCGRGVLGVMLGTGGGKFAPVVTYDSGGVLAYGVAVADLNGDGNLDVVAANMCPQSVQDCPFGVLGVLFGNGDGSLAGPVTYFSGGWHPSWVAIQDENEDGAPDLVVANTCSTKPDPAWECPSGSVGVLLNHGNGVFSPSVVFDTAISWTGPLAAGDFNRDGKRDLLVKGPNRMLVFPGNGDASYGSPITSTWTGDQLGGGPKVGDLNADGKLDILLSDSIQVGAMGHVAVMLGNGDGSFQPPLMSGSLGHVGGVGLGDMNGDGRLDALAVTQFGPDPNQPMSDIAVLLGNGDGSLQPPAMFASGAALPSAIAVADVNGDGKPDVITANVASTYPDSYPGAVVSVLLNDTPWCTMPPTVTASATPTRLWPPDRRMTPVTVFGTITDQDSACRVTTSSFAVRDEYGKVQPSGPVTLGSGGSFSFTVWLQASRLGGDLDGRLYTVTVSATNNAGKVGSQAASIVVSHDRGH